MPEKDDAPPPEDMRARLDSIPLLWREHDLLREEMRILLRWQTLAQDQFAAQARAGQDRFDREMAEITEGLHEATDKLNGLIGAVEQLGVAVAEMRRNFDDRLRRLEGQ